VAAGALAIIATVFEESGSTEQTEAPTSPASGTVSPTKAPSSPSPSPSAGPPVADGYSTTPLVAETGTDAVIEFAEIPGAPGQAIVAGQGGMVHKVSLDGSSRPEPWGDLSDRITFSGEQGLLSVAFSPRFAQDGRVYAYYTPGSPEDTVLSRFTASTDGLDEGSEQVLLTVEEFAGNHNGGHIVFDNDEYLLLSLGDGGGGGDPTEAAQDLTRLPGKVLRLDVSAEKGYTIPRNNPFDDGAGPIREEVYAYGFRNPWRMTVDPATNDTWLGDVGQNAREEVNLVVTGGNYGWDCFEGSLPFEPGDCEETGYEGPVADYGRELGQAVTGGVVYRGSAYPELFGWYVYGDFYSGHIWAVKRGAVPVHLLQAPFAVASFTLLADGEVAVVSYDDGVFRLSR
jgi:glucose/arabinose dehydrogenase